MGGGKVHLGEKMDKNLQTGKVCLRHRKTLILT